MTIVSSYEPIKRTNQLDGNKTNVVLIQATYTGYTTLYPAVGHLLALSLEQRTQEEGNWGLGIFVINPGSSLSILGRVVAPAPLLVITQNAHVGAVSPITES
jgi:hypothetical protein